MDKSYRDLLFCILAYVYLYQRQNENGLGKGIIKAVFF
jgi:hypothetical protein